MNNAGVVGVTDHDTTANCMTLAPLVKSQLKRRRVLFPEWLIEGKGAVALSENAESDAVLNEDIEYG
jgi:hypothetical protein